MVDIASTYALPQAHTPRSPSTPVAHAPPAPGPMTDPAPQSPGSRRDRLKQLRAFCEAVRMGSLSGAARAIASSQSAVSGHVQALEADLGVALLSRRGAGVVPTRVGENLYRIALPLAEKLLRLPDLFEEHRRGVASGWLRIGTGEVSGGCVLPPIVRRLHARHPDSRIDVRVGSGAERLAWLRGFEVDLVVAAFDTAPPDIEFHPLVVSEAVLATPEGHPLAARGRIDIAALSNCALLAQRFSRRSRQFQDVIFSLHGVRPRTVLEVDGWDTMLNYVAEGAGAAIVPDLVAARNKRVCMVRLDPPYGSRTYGLAVRRDRVMGLAAERFLHVALSGAGDGDEAR